MSNKTTGICSKLRGDLGVLKWGETTHYGCYGGRRVASYSFYGSKASQTCKYRSVANDSKHTPQVGAVYAVIHIPTLTMHAENTPYSHNSQHSDQASTVRTFIFKNMVQLDPTLISCVPIKYKFFKGACLLACACVRQYPSITRNAALITTQCHYSIFMVR